MSHLFGIAGKKSPNKAAHSGRFDSILFLAGSRHMAAQGWAALGSHLETNIWHFAEVFATC